MPNRKLAMKRIPIIFLKNIILELENSVRERLAVSNSIYSDELGASSLSWLKPNFKTNRSYHEGKHTRSRKIPRRSNFVGKVEERNLWNRKFLE